MEAIREVDKAIAELSATMEEIKAALLALFTEKMNELQEIKGNLMREIPAALEEVERTLPEEQPILITEYSALIRESTERSSSLQIFTCTVKACPPQSFFSVNYHFASPPPPERLAGMYNNQAFLYDIQSQQISKRTISVNFGSGSSYVVVDYNTLLCVGAVPASYEVYSMDLSSFQLTSLPSLSVPRNSPGVAKVKGYLCVFGGGDAGDVVLSSCEKMQLSAQRWERIGSMAQPRMAFTPCSFRSLLYLVSAKKETQRIVETYNADIDAFAVLGVSLPAQLQLGYASVAFIVHGELCLLTGGRQMARLQIDKESEFRLFETSQATWSRQQPIIVGSMVLIANGLGVQQFSLDTYSFVKYVK
jgi:hypothetical protein